MELAAVVDLLWALGSGLCAAGLVYGALLVYDFHCRATEAVLRTVARLALHESRRDLALGEGEQVARP